MGLTVHHLGHSQSDRIVWLCEELQIPYTLKKYDRSPLLSPPKYLALHPMGAAPVITDDDDDDDDDDTNNPLTLAETMACVEYILTTHGAAPAAEKHLVIKPGQPGYADYLYWLHFANGTLQPALGRVMALRFAGVDSETNNTAVRCQNKVDQALTMLDRRVRETGAWLAGDAFTVAEVVTVWSLAGMREFCPVDLSAYGDLLAWLRRCTERGAYRRAVEKADPDVDVESLIQGPPPPVFKALRK